MIGAGIDAGSRTIKIVLYDSDNAVVLASGAMDQGIRQEQLAGDLFHHLLNSSGISRADISKIVATGYGRNLIGFADTTITEISCHAFGVQHVKPTVSTVVEIGGQDSKVIKLNDKGTVQDFSMNDRCAAGTGRFLEVVASRLNVGLNDLETLASQSTAPASISSMCVVFAETEIVGLLASGVKPEDIAAGVQLSIARRVASMVGQSVREPVVFTGGVAMLPSMVKSLEASLGCPVEVPEQPLFTGALGAALMACRRARANDKEFSSLL